MLDKLCTDVFYELSKYLSFKEICIIKGCNKGLKNKILLLEKNIIKNHLNLYYKNELCDESYDNVRNNSLDIFYHFLQINMNNFYSKKLTIISDNYFINNLYKKIMIYCLKNNCNIKGYPYLFDLFIFYMLLNVDNYNNIYNSYTIHFLNLSTPKRYIYNDIFYDLKIKFYSYINSYIHNRLIIVDYDILIDISKYLTNICIIRRIFTYKKIDFSSTKLYHCCHYCAFKNLKEICNIKRLNYKDTCISENYNNLKRFLYIKNRHYYNYLLNREKIVVNDIIYVKNPITNKRMRINGTLYKKKMLEFYSLDYHIYKSMDNYINDKRCFFIKKYFS
jgi:hypothetical protein